MAFSYWDALFGTGAPLSQQLAQQGVSPVQLDQTASIQDRAQQGGFLNALQGQIAGTGPSAAQAQLSNALGQTVAAQQAAAAGGRYGQNEALRQRQVASGAAQAAAQAQNQSTQLRAQESQAAQGLYGSQLSGMRTQDISAAESQAQLQQQYNQMLAQQYAAQTGESVQAGNSLVSGILGAGAGLGSIALKGAMMAKGGVVHKPTMAMVGEKGPEMAMLQPGSVVMPHGTHLPLPVHPSIEAKMKMLMDENESLKEQLRRRRKKAA